MGTDNWQQLLDDPEIERMVQMVDSTTPPSGDPYLDDDRESYLWDRAVSAATRYKSNIDADDPTRYWRGYLWTVLRRAALYQRAYVYGNAGTARRAGESTRASLNAIIEDDGDAALALGMPDADEMLLDLGEHDEHGGRHRYPDAPGCVQISQNDPLYLVLRIERFETALRHAESNRSAGVISSTPASGLCSDVSCWEKSVSNGMCHLHDKRWQRAWTTKICSIDDCTNPAGDSRGLCGAHYTAWRRERPDAPRCLDCDRAVHGRGRCQYHARVHRQNESAG